MYRINLRHDLSNIDDIASAAKLAIANRYPSTICVIVEHRYGEDVIEIYNAFTEIDVIYRLCTTESPPPDSVKADPHVLTTYVNNLLSKAPRVVKYVKRGPEAHTTIMNYYLEMLL